MLHGTGIFAYIRAVDLDQFNKEGNYINATMQVPDRLCLVKTWSPKFWWVDIPCRGISSFDPRSSRVSGLGRPRVVVPGFDPWSLLAGLLDSRCSYPKDPNGPSLEGVEPSSSQGSVPEPNPCF